MHCRGQVYELSKGGSFVSDKPSAEIMVDVQDTRVVVAWPVNVGTRSESALSDRTWTEDASPRRALSAPRNRIASSPPPMAPRSPMSSPTPANRSVTSAPQMFTATSSNDIAGHSLVEVYEDPNSDPEPVLADQPVSRSPNAREALSATDLVKSSRSSFLSNEEFSDNDEENDPIVHSFGPFGENILPRLQSISTSASTDPPSQRRRKPLRATSNSPQKRTSSESTHQGSTSGLGIGISGDAAGESSFDGSPVKNHVINQLAFSRLSALPLSTIFGNLPTALKGVESSATAADSSATALTSPVLKDILVGIPCVGEISREGKDAAGKPLENEYYYVPEMDSDSMRREAVTSSRGGTGLRAARKNHKVRSTFRC